MHSLVGVKYLVEPAKQVKHPVGPKTEQVLQVESQGSEKNSVFPTIKVVSVLLNRPEAGVFTH